MVPAAISLPNFSGSVLQRRWQVLRMLGTGSYGVVYEGLDLHPRARISSPYCAIKIIRKAGRTPAQLLAIFEEVRLHGLVSKHPNVVTIHHAFEDDEYCYLILSLCRGGDLFERICAKGLYSNNDALLRRAFLSLVDAVRECHAKNVFHRDLKPENIMTNEEGSELYVADFGLATDRTTVHEHGCGTAVYMSPECIGRMTGFKPYCTRFSDIWALGVILVNMLSRQHPWVMATMEDCCFSRFVEDPDFFKKMLPITDGANAILLQILALNPLQRISLDDLRLAVLGLDAFFLPEAESSKSQYVMGSFEYPSPSGKRVVRICGCGEAPLEEMDIGEFAETIGIESNTRPRSTMKFVLRPARFSDQGSESYSDDSNSSNASDEFRDNDFPVAPEITTPKGSTYEEKDIGEESLVVDICSAGWLCLQV